MKINPDYDLIDVFLKTGWEKKKKLLSRFRTQLVIIHQVENKGERE